MINKPISNDWPNPLMPGVPGNPERDGPHQLNHAGFDVVLFWDAHSRLFFSSAGARIRPVDCAHWFYHGPCLTPAEVASQVAAACETEREAWLRHLRAENGCGRDGSGCCMPHDCRCAAEQEAWRQDAIRARGTL
jgi:hypothetical protein